MPLVLRNNPTNGEFTVPEAVNADFTRLRPLIGHRPSSLPSLRAWIFIFIVPRWLFRKGKALDRDITLDHLKCSSSNELCVYFCAFAPASSFWQPVGSATSSLAPTRSRRETITWRQSRIIPESRLAR